MYTYPYVGILYSTLLYSTLLHLHNYIQVLMYLHTSFMYNEVTVQDLVS